MDYTSIRKIKKENIKKLNLSHQKVAKIQKRYIITINKNKNNVNERIAGEEGKPYYRGKRCEV